MWIFHSTVLEKHVFLGKKLFDPSHGFFNVRLVPFKIKGVIYATCKKVPQNWKAPNPSCLPLGFPQEACNGRPCDAEQAGPGGSGVENGP